MKKFISVFLMGFLFFISIEKTNLFSQIKNKNVIDISPVSESVNYIEIDPINLNIIYVATINSGVFKSTDNGTSWRLLKNGLAENAITSIKVHPIKTNKIYLSSLNGLYLSLDQGDSWTKISAKGMYSIDFDPSDPNIMFGCGDGVFKSNDSGMNWIKIQNYSVGEYKQYYIFKIDEIKPSIYYWSDHENNDNIVLSIDPKNSNKLYLGSEEGLFISTTGGKTYTDIEYFKNMKVQSIAF